MNPQKALRTIAAIIPEDAGIKHSKYGNLLAQIYRIAHSNEGTCKHHDWENEATELHNNLVRFGEI